MTSFCSGRQYLFFILKMNKNEISSTLFRFVNVRNPQLIKPALIPTKFAVQDITLAKGTFYDAVTRKPVGTTKFEALTEASKIFTGIFATEKEVKALYPQLAEFSDWIMQNRENFTDAVLKTEAAKVKETFTAINLQRLWDNLFYQIVTAKDFYTKEALMQMLIAYNVKTKLSATDAEVNKTLVNASVAIPPELFLDDEPETKQDIPAPGILLPAMPTQIRKKQLTVLKSELSNGKLELLKKELTNLKEEYRKAYNAAYDTAYANYEKTIEPLLDTYNQAVERNRKSYCSTRGTTSLPYDENDPCQQPEQVPYPKLPKFTFSYAQEVESKSLENSLSYDSRMALLDVMGYDFESENLRTGDIQPSLSSFKLPDTFDKVIQEVDNSIGKNHQAIGNNTVLSGQMISIGGITLPVNEDTTTLHEDGFMVSPVKSARTYFYNLQLGTGEADIQKIVVTQKNAGGATTTKSIETPSASRTEGTITLNNIFSYTSPDGIAANAPELTFDVHLTNGGVKSIQGIKPNSTAGSLGTSKTLIAAPAKSVSAKQQFPITRHGVKKVGIADYLKVEQSVQCYVEGEVSHIENIMAREFKEKSTRRLTRTEDTTTISSETEREQLTDTTTADRFEIQSEAAKVIQQNKDFATQINGGISGKIPGGGEFFVNAGLNTATNTSKEESTRTAITEAKEITERALDRVVKKVKEERIRKVTEEFEENNRHGFDNRKGSQHVVGVYRWVDKLYKNQVVNYGRRLMYEFMIPEPAKLHLLGMNPDQAFSSDSVGTIGGTKNIPLIKPVDPRTFTGYMRIASYGDITEARSEYWAAIYNIENEPLPNSSINIGKSFAYGKETANPKDSSSAVGIKDQIDIPEGYETLTYSAKGTGQKSSGARLYMSIGDRQYPSIWSDPLDQITRSGEYLVGYTKSVPVSIATDRYWSFQVNVTLNCRPTIETTNNWKRRNFKAIIDAYEAALKEYNEKLSEIPLPAPVDKAEAKGTNPGFYRQIENTVLRKNCISYLVEKNSATNTYGKSMFNAANGNSFINYEVTNDVNLTNYAAYVKFIEQAFEWDIMSYSFYPFYWAGKNSWKQKYQFDESIDPTFRSFIQSGMARVMVTVRPGFEEAVQHFMATGIIWSGGKVPVIGSSMYLSVADDLKQRPAGTPEGKAWLTRVPTALTILQAGSAGLKVEKALPCDCANINDFENPDMIPCADNFELNQNLVGGPEVTESGEPQQLQTLQFTGGGAANAAEQETLQEQETPTEGTAGEETEPEQTSGE